MLVVCKIFKRNTKDFGNLERSSGCIDMCVLGKKGIGEFRECFSYFVMGIRLNPFRTGQKVLKPWLYEARKHLRQSMIACLPQKKNEI